MSPRDASSPPEPAAAQSSSPSGKRARPDDAVPPPSPATKRRRTASPAAADSTQQPGSPSRNPDSAGPANHPSPAPSAPLSAPFSAPVAAVTTSHGSTTPGAGPTPPVSPSSPAAPPAVTTAAICPAGCEVHNPPLSLYAPAVLPLALNGLEGLDWLEGLEGLEEEGENDLRERARRHMEAATASAPNGSPVLPPSFYLRDWDHPHRPVAWIKDRVTGAVRPRKMMDDFLDGTQSERESEEAAKVEEDIKMEGVKMEDDTWIKVEK